MGEAHKLCGIIHTRVFLDCMDYYGCGKIIYITAIHNYKLLSYLLRDFTILTENCCINLN